MMTKSLLMIKMPKMTMIMFESFVVVVFFEDYNLHTLCNATLILDGQEVLMLGKTCSNFYQTNICHFYYFSHAGLWRIKGLISSQLHTYSQHICRQKENVKAESNSNKKARL